MKHAKKLKTINIASNRHAAVYELFPPFTNRRNPEGAPYQYVLAHSITLGCGKPEWSMLLASDHEGTPVDWEPLVSVDAFTTHARMFKMIHYTTSSVRSFVRQGGLS